MTLNNKDGGNRRFVLIEREDYADRITAERIRRVIKGVPKAKDEALQKGLGGSFSFIEIGTRCNWSRCSKATSCKQSVFAICNKHAKKKTWNQLVPAMREKEIRYEVVLQDEWQKRLNELLAEH